jgi:hypothetical protein
MIETTLQHREQELRSLIDQIAAHPERDWAEARQRVIVLQRMVAGAAQV